jgi:hypothetical protein
MHSDEVWNNYELVLDDCLARLRTGNKKVDERDVRTIFEPVFMQIAKATGDDARQRTLVNKRLGDWQPADITDASLRTFVSRIVEAGTPPVPAFDMEEARRKMAEIERELAAPRNPERPLVGGAWA